MFCIAHANLITVIVGDWISPVTAIAKLIHNSPPNVQKNYGIKETYSLKDARFKYVYIVYIYMCA